MSNRVAWVGRRSSYASSSVFGASIQGILDFHERNGPCSAAGLAEGGDNKRGPPVKLLCEIIKGRARMTRGSSNGIVYVAKMKSNI